MDTKVFAIVMPVGPALAETDKSLPFAEFGRTGGYGIIRSKLVKAIRSNDWSEAQRWFDTLVAEGFQDEYDEAVFDAEAEDHGPEYTSVDHVRRDFILRAVRHPELTDCGKWIAKV